VNVCDAAASRKWSEDTGYFDRLSGERTTRRASTTAGKRRRVDAIIPQEGDGVHRHRVLRILDRERDPE